MRDWNLDKEVVDLAKEERKKEAKKVAANDAKAARRMLAADVLRAKPTLREYIVGPAIFSFQPSQAEASGPTASVACQ
jgi:hypothetical protein